MNDKSDFIARMIDRSAAEADIIRAVEKLGAKEVIAIVLRHVDRKHIEAQKVLNAAKAAAQAAHDATKET